MNKTEAESVQVRAIELGFRAFVEHVVPDHDYGYGCKVSTRDGTIQRSVLDLHTAERIFSEVLAEIERVDA